MRNEHFGDRLVAAVREKKSILCVGLDPQLLRIPKRFIAEQMSHTAIVSPYDLVQYAFRSFNRAVIDAVEPFVAAVKPQIAFYEKYGSHGLAAYEDAIYYARRKGLIVIGDVKRGDGGDTAEAYAEGHIGEVDLIDHLSGGVLRQSSPIRVDAATVKAYIGDACLEPFVRTVQAHDAGIFVVAKTSFKPASCVEELQTVSGMKVWEEVANQVGFWSTGTLGDSGYCSVGAVLGATYPDDGPRMRRYLRQHWFLVPGYGAQGGGADDAVRAANDDGLGVLVNSSRGIIYAGDPAEAARSARDELNAALSRAGKGPL